MPSTSNDSSTQDTKPAIVINNISKSFKIKHDASFKEAFVSFFKRQQLSTQFKAVDGLSLEVPAGQSIAIMGRNGSGKSTTLKLLSGVLRPETGWVRTRGRVAGLIEVGAGFNPNLTGRDNVYLNAAILGMSKKEVDERFDDILEFSEIGDFIDTEVKYYSSGMYARLGFAVAVHTEFDVLLVDEVLSVGDVNFRKKCQARMQELRAKGKTMFIVSHSSGQVRQLCDRAVVLHQGKLVFDGGVEEALKVLETTSGSSVRRAQRAQKGPYDEFSSIEKFLKAQERSYGEPSGKLQAVEANGGGLLQVCAKGVVTASKELKLTKGLPNGRFQRAYVEAGGPKGEWGFIAGNIQTLDVSGKKSLRFQHGTALFDPENGFTFVKD